MMSLRFPMAGTPFLAKSIATLLITAMPTLALADLTTEAPIPQKKIDFVVGGGLTFGGDEIADVRVIDYDDDDSSEDVSAGALIHIYTGINAYIPDSDFSVQTTIGYHVDGIFASNGSVAFTRYPLELIPYYNFNRIRIGLGLSYHINPEFSGDSDAGLGDREYDNALGLVASVEVKLGSHFAVGLHYTDIDYDLSKIEIVSGDNFNEQKDSNIDGSNVGIYGTYLF
jgi:hypothetical protein